MGGGGHKLNHVSNLAAGLLSVGRPCSSSRTRGSRQPTAPLSESPPRPTSVHCTSSCDPTIAGVEVCRRTSAFVYNRIQAAPPRLYFLILIRICSVGDRANRPTGQLAPLRLSIQSSEQRRQRAVILQQVLGSPTSYTAGIHTWASNRPCEPHRHRTSPGSPVVVN